MTASAMLSRHDYTVACICPMGLELAPVEALLDKTHPGLPQNRDQNNYVLGEMSGHNVVVAVMAEIGNNQAAITATQLINDFPSVRFGLLVGIGGGIPDENEGGNDIRLGDVVVSKPNGRFSGVVQYDRGKTTIHGFEHTTSLNKPPPVLLSAVERLRSSHRLNANRIPKYLEAMSEKHPSMSITEMWPSAIQDQLFKASYNHRGNRDCGGCDKSQLIARKGWRRCKRPVIHYGTIGSANTVLKNATERGELKRKFGIICVEMEAAGLMESFPCLVIRGICDYADSHKIKIWQRYAAATAAAYMKELLMTIPAQDVERQVKVIDVAEFSSQISELIDVRLSDLGKNLSMKGDSEMIRGLSKVNFWGNQDDIFKRAHPDTGKWIFEDERFQTWLTGSPHLLLCLGKPGAGKTILSSIIINHLCSKNKNQNVGLAWLYISYRQHNLQTTENLFMNILVQLFNQRGEISQSMKRSLGFNWEGAKPSRTDFKTWLQEEVLKFSEVIIIIDALDEMRTKELCNQFIDDLQCLKGAVRLLLLSQPTQGFGFERSNSVEIEIRPQKEDVIHYIQSRFKDSQKLRQLVQMDPTLQELAIEKLADANDEMFLKAELILNVLEYKETIISVRDALNSLPSDYKGCYENTLKEIDKQDLEQRGIAFRVLAWLSHALGQLTVKALQEALAIQLGDEIIDESRQIPEHELKSTCKGLVLIQTFEDVPHIQLIHGTAGKFFENNQFIGIPRGHELILNASLAYLSLPTFSDICFFKIRLAARADQYPFYDYAVRYWSAHAVQGNLESAFREKITRFLESNQRYSADEYHSSELRSAWGCDYGTPWTDWNRNSINRKDTPLHAAATYGLRETIRFLLKEKGYAIECRNNFGETALHRAAQVGSTASMEELIAHGTDLLAKVRQHYLNDATPLILATLCNQVEVVRILMNHGVDVNTFDPVYGTFPLHLAASMDTKMTRLLLNRGPLVSHPAKSPFYPEAWPMTSLHFAVFNANAFPGAFERLSLLIERGIDVNVQSSTGNTALHMAILADQEDLARLLLLKGTDIKLKNKNDKTAIQLARERGHLDWLKGIIPDHIFHALQSGPQLHQAIWSKNIPLVQKLLETGDYDIGDPDEEGVTPWEYCIRSADIELANVLMEYMKIKNQDNSNEYLKQIGNSAFEMAMANMTAFDYTDQKRWRKTLLIAKMLLSTHQIFDPNMSFAKTLSPICNYQKTYLICAAEQGRREQVEFLLECGSDVNAQDAFGTTGLHYAIGNKNMDMVRFLVEKGQCDLTIKDRKGVTALTAAEMTEKTLICDYIRGALTRSSTR